MATSTRVIGDIRRRLLAWYATEQRAFPWRRTRDAWAVLISEVMLQQTQASRVVLRFPAFLARFPTAASMAAASEADVLRAWAGLGYNRRALALRRAAIAIQREGWPRAVAELRQLPGIGPYTARAVAALAFGEPVGVVDTNVRRWLTRRFGLAVPARAAALQELADELATADHNVTSEAAAAWVHASMEFGGRVCRARAPACGMCPIARGCPSRDRAAPVPVKRQAPFSGSNRALRGALLRELVSNPNGQLSMAVARRVAGERLDTVLQGLDRDRLAHRSGQLLKLGGRAGDRATTTIGS